MRAPETMSAASRSESGQLADREFPAESLHRRRFEQLAHLGDLPQRLRTDLGHPEALVAHRLDEPAALQVQHRFPDRGGRHL